MSVIAQLFDLLAMLILIDVLLSWVVQPDQFPRSATRQLTEPLYEPLRQVLDPQKTGGLDLAPLVWILGLQLLASMIGG